MNFQSRVLERSNTFLVINSTIYSAVKTIFFGFCFFGLVPIGLAESDFYSQSDYELTELPVAVQDSLSEYQYCVSHVMSTFDVAAIKRQRLVESCQQAKNELVNAYPEDIQGFVNAKLTDRLAQVLFSLEQSEKAILEAVVDSHEIARELEALSEKVSNEFTE